MMKSTLEGKIVMMQGAGRAPGPQMARAFAAEGALVAACDLSPALLNPLEAASPNIRGFVGDVARGMPARAVLDEILEEWNRVDVLINNPRVSPQAALIDLDEYDFQRTIDANLNGAFLLTRLAARLMRDQGGGVIINVVETLANAPAAYAASQAGLLALSQTAAKELIAYNIHVFAVCIADRQGEGAQTAGTPHISGLSLEELAVDLTKGSFEGSSRREKVFWAAAGSTEKRSVPFEE
jgi:NAD(P)-dependent dehydrogenase (short-subunit alcohol dehydrogenase family)